MSSSGRSKTVCATHLFLAAPSPDINADVSTTPSGATEPASFAAAFTAEIDPRLVPTSQTAPCVRARKSAITFPMSSAC